MAFEEKNLSDEACCSWAGEGLVADYAFEVSSEGELEQVYPLIERILDRGGRVEVLFASASVEKKCQKLYEAHGKQVRILRLPLLTYFPRGLGRGQNIAGWMTAPVLILCRYDFYPELFLYGLQTGRRFYLVSAGLKNKSRLWAPLYGCFDKIVCSHESEQERFLKWGYPRNQLTSYEFRSVQILSRLECRERKLAPWKRFISWIEAFAVEERLVLGNAWPAEMEILQGPSLQKKVKRGKFLVVIAPHKTGTTFIRNLEEQMENVSAHILSHPTEWESVLNKWKESPGPIIFNVSGVLLEFYSLFRHALVGGGHGKGVHSLLEPFLAGCSLYCGPKVDRSSEYDFVKKTSPRRIYIVENWKQFSQWGEPCHEHSWGHLRGQFEEVASWLLEDKRC